jgi:hypothetical protein
MFINLTPHRINPNPNNPQHAIEPSGIVIHLSSSFLLNEWEVDGIKVQGPRSQILKPGPLLRNAAGQPVGCDGLSSEEAPTSLLFLNLKDGRPDLRTSPDDLERNRSQVLKWHREGHLLVTGGLARPHLLEWIEEQG